jgi:hypothetical protein
MRGAPVAGVSRRRPPPKMSLKPLLVLRESPRLIPERIREFDVGTRTIIRASLIYGIPCALVALYLYRTEIAPLIDPPAQPDPTVGILSAPFLFPLMFVLPRMVLSVPRFRGAWRTRWTLWPKGLTRQSALGSAGIAWRDVETCTVEPQGADEVSIRLGLSVPLRGQGTQLELTCLRQELPCDADSLRDRIAALMTAARPFSG